MNRLEGKVCLVTGGAAGIGRAIVERFASEGAKMVVACDVNPCEYTEPNVVGKILNVTDREGIKALVKEIVEENESVVEEKPKKTTKKKTKKTEITE